jgi:hypothetical protein
LAQIQRKKLKDNKNYPKRNKSKLLGPIYTNEIDLPIKGMLFKNKQTKPLCLEKSYLMQHRKLKSNGSVYLEKNIANNNALQKNYVALLESNKTILE